ncbi:MAG: two component, sigma54 specific, transcriptional regulator, Fis family [Acidobacteria bacterium]|jgi:DNA-binding NtrC family response regulator|nr:two component, sigma54 specific, transcriptional regulator, Fis family [Acidobacteriota bacterium]
MINKSRILVVDDEEVVRDVLSTLLGEGDYLVDLAENGPQALDMVRSGEYEAILLDLMMPGMDGLEVLESVQKAEDPPQTIVLTAYATIEKAVRATRLGAFDFITKPFKNDEILLAVKNAVEQRRLRRENLRLKNSLRERYSYRNIIGKSAAMQQTFELIAQVAPRRSTILIQGESGTGKELAAKAIHAASTRADAPFVAINCGNIPSELLESEIFGHVRGAFTGATSTKKGLFELADGGTLFLDEVASISLEIQSKLLRVIQEREFRRLGGLESIKVDVRIIAATNRDLQDAVAAGSFRDDLYYRLNVIVIKLPPLRGRAEDIPLLADHFLKKYCDENGRDACVLDTAALRALMDYAWPGNVRELENAIERAVVLCPGNLITADLLPRNITEPPVPDQGGLLGDNLPLKERVVNFERTLILAALEQTDWNQKRAADLLLVNPTTLSEKLKRLKIKSR